MAENTATAAPTATAPANQKVTPPKGGKTTPETLAAAAQKVEETASKLGTAKHFDQPGVKFSIEQLRALELLRKEQTGESFRMHVESALLYYYLNPQNDWDKTNAPPKAQLEEWYKKVLSGESKGGGAAAKERETTLRNELEEAKKKIAELTANMAKK